MDLETILEPPPRGRLRVADGQMLYAGPGKRAAYETATLEDWKLHLRIARTRVASGSKRSEPDESYEETLASVACFLLHGPAGNGRPMARPAEGWESEKPRWLAAVREVATETTE